MDFSAAEVPRPESRLGFHTPIHFPSAHQRAASNGYSNSNGFPGSSAAAGAERESFPREVTFASFYTTTTMSTTQASMS